MINDLSYLRKSFLRGYISSVLKTKVQIFCNESAVHATITSDKVEWNEIPIKNVQHTHLILQAD